MKRFVLISMLLLFAVVVSAQDYDAKCYDDCRKSCISEKMAEPENCDKICADNCPRAPIKVEVVKPIIKPVPPADCASVCRTEFAKCEHRLTIAPADCKLIFDQCSEKCAPPAPRQSCQDACRELASKAKLALVAVNSPSFDITLYVQCMRDRCKQNCESSCRALGGDPYPCILKECRKPGLSCDDNCAFVRKDCLDLGADQTSCDMKGKDCLSGCYPQAKPECPRADECSSSCVKGYYACSFDKPTCDKHAGDCLDKCADRVPKPQEPQCGQRCAEIEKRCTTENVDQTSCMDQVRKCKEDCAGLLKSEMKKEEVKKSESVFARLFSVFRR